MFMKHYHNNIFFFKRQSALILDIFLDVDIAISCVILQKKKIETLLH